ncbi:MAG TPA: FkbM family methyltransferase [Thermoanaerobaculia bacterium]|nr:FkbM family methyltransferase [Thermoanaerobaculia bacterium]
MSAGPAKALLGRVLGERRLDRVRRAWHRLRESDPRLALRRRAFSRANAGLPSDRIEIRPGLRLSVEPEARDGFEHFCFRSLDMARELDGFLAHCRGHGGRRHRLLDVGALHGLFSLAFTAGRPDAEALAIEPSPLAFPVLEANLRRNPEARARAQQVAAGAGEGEIAMRLDWHHLEACSAEEAGAPGVLTVPLRTLDAICFGHEFLPDVIKLDVEGYELETLRGAERLLGESRPDLFLEAHPASLERLGTSMAELFDHLRRFDYRVFDVRDRPVSATDFAAERAVTRYRCAPDSRGHHDFQSRALSTGPREGA